MAGGMEEALSRMEKGEDPEQIEADLGDVHEGEDPFIMARKKGRDARYNRPGTFPG